MKETPKRLAPTTETLRALFARSGNQCAFPDCDHPLIDEDNNFVAQVCHIEDALPGGRFNENMNNEQRRSYSNLVLFCYRHHIQTNNVEKFPVPKLHEIKILHESRFTETFVVNETLLINIFNDLKSVKDDTTAIRKVQQSHTQYLEEIKAILSPKKQEAEAIQKENGYTQEIETILKLRDNNNHKAVLQLLADFKIDKWEKLNGNEKHKLIVNMGICHLELSNQNEAAKCFIESIKHDPENEKALGFAALGYSLLGDTKEARNNIAKSIEKNPKNTNAYVALILIEKDNLEFSELFSQVPIELHDTQEISYAIGALARHKNDFDTAINWFQNAVDVAEKNKAQLKATLASTILESVTNPFQILTGQVDNESRNRINYSIELLTEAWEEYKDSDLRNSNAWILVNRGIAKKFLGDLEGAFEDINQASTVSENSYFIIRHLAIVALETKKLDRSLELLDKLKSIECENNKDELDVYLIKAQVLFEKKEFNQAIDTLKVLLQNTSNQKVKEEAQSRLIFTYVEVNNFEEAKKLSTSIIENRPDYLRGFLDASKVHAYMNETEEAIDLLNIVYERLNDESNKADVQELAYQFVRYNDYPKTIELLERITNPQIYTELSRTLLRAYYDAGETRKALRLCQLIRSSYGPIDLITEMQSAIYESIGDLQNAIKVCEEYLSFYPDDQRIKVRLALIYARIKDDDKVKEILERLDVLGELPIDVLYQLAYLNISVGELKRGLNIAFETRRKFINNSEAHIKYIGLFSEFKELTEYVGDVQQVGLDTVVKIKDESGELQTYYIFDKYEKLSKEELAVTDALAQSLIGSKTDDTIEFDRGLGNPQRFEVVAILSKYVYAFQESIELLGNKFVDVKGFRVLNSGTSGDIKKDLKPIFDSLDQAESFDKHLFDYYNQKLLTIGTCAQLRKQNPIKFWSIVYGNPEFGIYSISSWHKELQIAHVLLEKETGIVVDLVSLLTLASIKLLVLLEVLPSKKVIAQSSIDQIDELIREFKGISADGFITIGKVNGEYVKEHVTKERIEISREHFEALLRWIKQNCVILPCNEALTMNASRKEQFDKTLGRAFIDSILIAKEHEYLFLAEEESLRAIASTEFQVRGFPSYVLLTYSLKNGIINGESFNKEIAKLIGLGYKFLPINSEILMKCADMAGYKPVFPFNLAIKTLDFSISSEDSSIHVAAEFMYKVYTTTTLPQVRLGLIIPLLDRLFNGRNFINVLQKLMVLVEIKFKLLQLQKDEVQFIIMDFIKGKN